LEYQRQKLELESDSESDSESVVGKKTDKRRGKKGKVSTKSVKSKNDGSNKQKSTDIKKILSRVNGHTLLQKAEAIARKIHLLPTNSIVSKKN
jgi:hypothetical protein